MAGEILAHHERWDGKGYPEGLKRDDIPLLSRLVAVVDAYDVMISGRPYKNAQPPERACAEIRDGAGTQFDPQIVDIFLSLWEKGEID